ncbi:hypothetical protein [Bacillus swezeyi]|uniref:hypothetical protein n=1 Tax=Bacillus swezeyi TaxID=1925020 RepID=UPI0016534AC2|nr:hypothetical protein [Bacillus swezeyi]
MSACRNMLQPDGDVFGRMDEGGSQKRLVRVFNRDADAVFIMVLITVECGDVGLIASLV